MADVEADGDGESVAADRDAELEAVTDVEAEKISVEVADGANVVVRVPDAVGDNV